MGGGSSKSKPQEKGKGDGKKGDAGAAAEKGKAKAQEPSASARGGAGAASEKYSPSVKRASLRVGKYDRADNPTDDSDSDPGTGRSIDDILEEAVSWVQDNRGSPFSLRCHVTIQELYRRITGIEAPPISPKAQPKSPRGLPVEKMRSSGTQTEVVVVGESGSNMAPASPYDLRSGMPDRSVSFCASGASSDGGQSTVSSTLSRSVSSSICAMSNTSVMQYAEREVQKALQSKRSVKIVDGGISDTAPQAGSGGGAGDSSHVKVNLYSPRANVSEMKLDTAAQLLSDVAQAGVADGPTVLQRCLRRVQEFCESERCVLWNFDAGAFLQSDGVAELKSLGISELTLQDHTKVAREAFTKNELSHRIEKDMRVTAVPLPCGSGSLTVEKPCVSFDKSMYGVFASLLSHIIRVKRLYDKAIFQQKKSTAMLSLADHLCKCSLNSSVSLDILNVARDLCMANASLLYTIRPNRKEMTVYFQTPGASQPQVLQVPLGGDLISEIAATGEGIALKDAYSDTRFDRSIDQLTGHRTQSLLCLPIAYEGLVQAVAVLVNKAGGIFEESDMELFDSFVAFVGVALRNAYYYKEMLREKATTDMVLAIVKKVAESDIRYIDSVSESVIQGAKQLCHADRCALFLKDEEKGQIVAKLPDGNEIRIPVGAGIAGAVGKTGNHVNIRHAYEDTRFNQDVDKKTGYTTESILCYPIHCNGEVIAVAQLINKHDELGRVTEFDGKDEVLLQSFAEFAGITIGNARLYNFVVQAGDDAMRLYTLQMNGDVQATSEHAKKVKFATEEEVERLKKIMPDPEGLEHLSSCDFPIHKYDDRPEELAPFVVAVFQKLGLVDRFQLNEHRLYHFLAALQNMYRPIPYHNISHAFDVMQTLFMFLSAEDTRSKLTDLDVLCLMLIGLLHDVDHMGLNNSFHLKAETPLGILISASGSSSVLEVHHCTIAIEMLQDERTNFLHNLVEDEVKQVYKILTSAILATDMTKHRTVAEEFGAIGAEYKIDNIDHRMRLISVLTIVADVSNAYKPFDIARQWGAKITSEFNTQGEAEKKQDLPQTFREEPTIFKQQVSFCKSQIGFVTGMVLPLLKVLEGCMPSFVFAIDQIDSNIKNWNIICHTSIVAHTVGCRTDKGLLFRYYYKFKSFTAIKRKSRGIKAIHAL